MEKVWYVVAFAAYLFILRFEKTETSELCLIVLAYLRRVCALSKTDCRVQTNFNQKDILVLHRRSTFCSQVK